MTHITVITEFLCGTVNRGVTEETKVVVQVIDSTALLVFSIPAH